MKVDRVRAQLDRVLASAAFAGATRPSAFLRFIVERALEGRTSEIKESVIAVEVFKRDPSFDPKADPIVRVEAGRLRERLSSYYRTDGEADTVAIELPKGGYVPTFSERAQTSEGSARVLKLSIVLPVDASIDSFVISPNGRTLAFTAIHDGKQLLWLRDLDSLEARPLPGTDYATYPFWSPDSRQIGFFTPSKLKCIDRAGGPARDIADVIVGRGAAWAPDGSIVFTPRPLGPLHRVADTGGAVSCVSVLDQARGELVHGFPHFLPDGRHFIYHAMGVRADQSSIRVTSLDGEASKVLVETDTSAAYAPAFLDQRNVLAFVSAGTLMTQPLDPKRLALDGERSIVARDVHYRRWYQASFSVSADGMLLYRTGSPEHHRFSWLGRDGALVEECGAPNDAVSFSLSPDEQRVAFYRDSDPSTVCPKIWVMDLAREGAVARITDSEIPEPEFTPVWSADGCEVLFSRGKLRMRLMRQPVNGGAATCVLDSAGPKFPTDWSANGRFILYSSQVPDYRFLHVWTAELDSSQPGISRPFLQHAYPESNAYFAPTDNSDAPRFVAYTSAETERDEVYVRDFPDGPRKWQVSSRGGLMPHWRRDGKELFYLAPDGVLMAVPVTLGTTVEIGAPRPLFATGITFVPQHKSWMNQYAVSRDGQRFLINRPTSGSVADNITVLIRK